MKSGLPAYCTIVSLLLASLCFGQQPKAPVIPDHVFSVTDFGAQGDGQFLNTNALQQALDKAGMDGGTVIIPKGVFLCGPVSVKSNTHLVLENGAVLKLWNNADSFPVLKDRYLNFITAKNASNIKISGEGIIDGQGQGWWDKFTGKEITLRRPQMLYLEECERLEIEGITFLNPPNTHVSLKRCSNVYIHGITINAPEKSRNTDGLNISVRNCLIENCSIQTGDDNIAINFGGQSANDGHPECENITIRNCHFGYGHGLSIGSYTAGGLNNLAVSDCTFNGTTAGIRIKTARGRGGLVQNITYSNISMEHVKWPVFISEYYPKEPKAPEEDTARDINKTTPVYRNITLQNIKATEADDAIKIWGLPESPIENLVFINVKIAAKTGAQIFHAKGVRFEQTKLKIAHGEELKTYHATINRR